MSHILANNAAAMAAAALFFLFSCSRMDHTTVLDDIAVKEMTEGTEMVFKALFAQTKTTVEGNKVSWQSGDRIGIIDNFEPDICHLFVTSESGSSASFVGEVSSLATAYMAVYPYDASARANFSTGVITTTLSADQSLAPGEGTTALMTCKTVDNTLLFHHAGGIVSFSLKASDHVSRVLFRGNAGESVAGDAAITVGDATVATAVSGSYSVSAIPSGGETFADGTYYLSVAPGTYSSGFSLHLFSDNHKEAEGTVSGEKVVACGGGFNLGTVSPASEKWKASVSKNQKDVYVSPNGTGEATGIDEANTMSLSDFTRIMNYGDGATGSSSYSAYAYKSDLIKDKTFHLAAGTYPLSETLHTYSDYGKGSVAFRIEGAGRDDTILDGSSCAGSALHVCSVSEPAIQGMTFRNFSATNGGAIRIENSRITVYDCLFSHNSATEGGAIYCDAGSLFLSGSVFKDNSATNGGHAVLSSSADEGFAGIHNCTFIASEGASGTDVQSSSSMALTNNTFCSASSAPSHLCVQSQAEVANKVVLVGNILSDASGGGVASADGRYITSAGYNIYDHGHFTTEGGVDQSDVPSLTLSPDEAYFSWNGSTEFAKPVLSTEEDIIAGVTLGASVTPTNILDLYIDWLRNDGGLYKDIRKVNRNAQIWPGSYQEGSGTSSLNGTVLDNANNIFGMIVNSETGAAIPGVPVTDGFQFVLTDANGVYQFHSANGARRVYYTLPSGYEVTLDPDLKRPAFFDDHDISGITYYRKDFILTPASWDQSKFTMLWVGDPQAQTLSEVARFNNETVTDIIATVNAKQAAGEYLHIYGQTMGDIVYNASLLWPNMKTSMSNLPLAKGGYLPFYQMMGNHDKDARTTTDPDGMFYQYMGPKDYSYNIGDVHVIIMDDIRQTSRYSDNSCPDKYKWNYNGGFTDAQMEWLRQDLELIENKSQKLVLFGVHIPILSSAAMETKILPLLTPFKEAHVLSAHYHYPLNRTHTSYVCAGGLPIYEHVTPAACGSFWKSSLNVDGSPNGYSLYEIENAAVKNWIYKATGHPMDYQMRVYDGNATYADAPFDYHWYEVRTPAGGSQPCKGDPRLKDCFVVSLWNDDTTNWTVEFYQGGVKVGDFTRVAPGEAGDVCTTTFNFKNGWRSQYYNGYAPGHIWYYKPASGEPSSESDWEVVATQTIPGSGVVNVYRANTFQTDFTGFAAP